jgi:mevalonate kinase
VSFLGSVPGKVFLLGEYAVLARLPCVVIAVGPRFHTRRISGADLGEIHPESPAGKLLAWSEKTLSPEIRSKALEDLEFNDPLSGAGGFGASTAQFALIYGAMGAHAGWDLSAESSWREAWKLYRELTRKESEFKSPSGADLVGQWRGGLTWFDPAVVTADNLYPCADFSGLMVFSATGQAGRKVATHFHLDSLTTDGFRQKLAPITEAGAQAIRRGDLADLGLAMNDYAQALQSMGLEIAPTTADREALSQLPGVLGVKGAGAMQADAVLVLVDPAAGADARELVQRLAESRGLRLVCSGLSNEEGLTQNKVHSNIR